VETGSPSLKELIGNQRAFVLPRKVRQQLNVSERDQHHGDVKRPSAMLRCGTGSYDVWWWPQHNPKPSRLKVGGLHAVQLQKGAGEPAALSFQHIRPEQPATFPGLLSRDHELAIAPVVDRRRTPRRGRHMSLHHFEHEDVVF